MVDGFRFLGLVRLIGGPIYSRGEGFHENRVFTDPEADGWSGLPHASRREFLRHTDRGVFSHYTVGRLREPCSNFSWATGRVTDVVAEQYFVTVRFEAGPEQRFDYLIVAIGFDTLWFRRIMSPSAGAALDRLVGAEWAPGGEGGERNYLNKLEQTIDYDLGVGNGSELPRLHLPMLAAMNQGPGFPNLSCLGRLADRILHSHIGNVDPHLAGGVTGPLFPPIPR